MPAIRTRTSLLPFDRFTRKHPIATLLLAAGAMIGLSISTLPIILKALEYNARDTAQVREQFKTASLEIQAKAFAEKRASLVCIDPLTQAKVMIIAYATPMDPRAALDFVRARKAQGCAPTLE